VGSRARIGRGLIAGLALACALAPAQPAVVQDPRPGLVTEDGTFGVEDYFRIQRFGGLALSDDAEWLAYSTEIISLEKDQSVRNLHLRSLSGGGAVVSSDALEGAWALAWIPGTHALAFLSARSGTVQVHSYDVESGQIRQLTSSNDPVISFRFAPDGKQLAHATRPQSRPGTSLYEQFRTAKSGLLIDPDTISSHDFVNPDWNAMVHREPAALWVGRLGREARRVPVPGEPVGYQASYFWSADGTAISVGYLGKESRSDSLGDDRTSVGIFDPRSGRFHELAKAIAPTEGRPAISYSGGEWIPGERRILLRRVVEKDPWVSGSFPDWTIARASGPLPANDAWRPVELYPRDLNFLPARNGRILVENTVRGEHSLFQLTPAGLERSEVAAGLDGSSGKFSFSADGRTAVFVNESLARPPEIFVKRGNTPPRQLTSLNAAVAREIGFTAIEVSWKSTDGVTVSGWLLKPREAGQTPLPLITHVHGGPAFPFPNEFAAYFDYWPYPLEAYPARGIAVFLPNYRGTHTYGREIATATGDEQAIVDIVSGVKALVDAGVADPARLAISGHSHGALVGPLAMARSKMFRASSFAEGVSNQVVMYELMSGDANRYIHDPTIGVSLYQSPETYIEGSADLQLKGVTTASLFEAGAKTSAIFMLGLAKAAERFGMPSEFVIYPRTAHNLAIPTLQKESAERNLDWFDFWLNGREDPNPAKQQQYSRWRSEHL
jgi:dipeptidyl aminopeptidase/acylaminoacyl peptidase